MDNAVRLMRFARLFVLFATSLLLAWYAFNQSVSQILQSRDPALAVVADTRNAQAWGILSNRLLWSATSDEERMRAERPAKKAMKYQPVERVALRNMGIIASIKKNEREGRRLLNLADRFSHRDLATHIWKIEQATRAGDVAEALRLYDVTLRSDVSSHELLFPILIDASSSADLAKPIAQLIARDPPWLKRFWIYVTNQRDAPLKIVPVVKALPPGRDITPDPVKEAILVSLIREEREDDAIDLNRLFAGDAHPLSGDLLTQNAKEGIQPFNWLLHRSGNLSGSFVAEGLMVDADRGPGGIAAVRVFTSIPGTYSLTGKMTTSSSSAAVSRMPVVELRCVRTKGRLLRIMPSKPVDDLVLQGQFTVPQGCRLVQLRIISPPIERSETVRAIFSQLTVDSASPETISTSDSAQ